MSSEERRSLPRGCRGWLEGEISHWEHQGLITPDQATAIRGLYPWQEESPRSRTTGTVTLLGAVLVGLGAILFVAANWPSIPRMLKLALLLSAVAGSHGLGWWLWRERGTAPRVGHALVVLGNLLFGAGIWLVAQMFHLSAHWPTGLLVWALGVAAVAWAADSRPSLILATLLLGAWNILEQGSEQLNITYLPLLIGLAALAYRLRSPVSLLMNQLGLSFWVGLNVARLEGYGASVPTVEVAALGLLGAAFLALGMGHEPDENQARRPLAWPHLMAGSLLVLLALLIPTTLSPFSGKGALDPRTGWSLVALGIMALAAGAWAAGRWRRMAGRSWQVAAPVAAVAVGVAIPPLALWLPVGTPVRLTFNLLLLAAILAQIAYGYARRNEALVNLALLAFVVQVVARYFDWFWQLLDRSLFFIGGGLLLLLGGYLLERNRRRWLRDWQGGNWQGGNDR